METSVSTATQHEQPQPEVTQSATPTPTPQIDFYKRKRSNNTRYGTGPSLQEQRDFLNGINREYYTRKYIHSV
jgi:hypothetical protein